MPVPDRGLSLSETGQNRIPVLSDGFSGYAGADARDIGPVFRIGSLLQLSRAVRKDVFSRISPEILQGFPPRFRSRSPVPAWDGFSLHGTRPRWAGPSGTPLFRSKFPEKAEFPYFSPLSGALTRNPEESRFSKKVRFPGKKRTFCLPVRAERPGTSFFTHSATFRDPVPENAPFGTGPSRKMARCSQRWSCRQSRDPGRIRCRKGHWTDPAGGSGLRGW